MKEMKYNMTYEQLCTLDDDSKNAVKKKIHKKIFYQVMWN